MSLEREKGKSVSSYFIIEMAKFMFGFVLLASVLFVLVYGYSQFSSRFATLKKVYVNGNRVLAASYIAKEGIGEFFKPINYYKLSSIYMSLVSDPWIKSARITKIYPDTIVINILEKRPIALVYTPKGAVVIGKDGYIIDKYSPILKLPSSVCKIKIKQESFLKDKNLIKSVITFYEKLDKIAKINYIEIVSDSYQVAYLVNGLKIGINSLDCPSDALKRLRESLPYLLSLKDKIESVSICFNNKFVVKRRKGVKK